MPADPLVALLKLRRQAVEEGRRAVAALIRAETEAEQAHQDARDSLAREAEAASRMSASDHAVEAYAAWLPVGRAAEQAAQRRLDADRAATAGGRSALALARAALRAAEILAEQRAAALATLAARREQAALDEAGRPRETGLPTGLDQDSR